jgi:hypothetical protein
MAPAAVSDGAEYVLPDCGFTAPAGKEFRSWPVTIGDADPVTRDPGESITVTADTVVTAVWGELTAPAFGKHALLLSSEIGIKFRVSFPEDFDPTGCRVEFTATDGNRLSVPYANAETISGSTDRYFTFYVNALELADTVTATLRYGSGETVTNQYSVMTYIETVRDMMSDNEKLIDLVDALHAYGYYMQHSGWADNKNAHTAIEAPSELLDDTSMEEAAAAVSGKTVEKDYDASVIDDAKFSLALNEKTVINISVKPADGVQITSGGYTTRIIGSDTYYQFSTAPIGAKNLGTAYDIVVQTDHGTATITASAMSYVRAALNSGSMAREKKLAMTAYYQYYAAAVRY